MTQVGKYQLVSKLATGGMAEVFLAKVAGPMGFEKTLVLKRVLPHLAEDPQFVGMFFTEARVAAQLNHPHIVQIFDFGQAEGTYYLAMEYIDGPDLRTLSTRATQSDVRLPPAICAKIVSAACEGLAFAHDFVDPASGQHQGLIHRDISPDNILLSRQGAVKVVDFGIAKATNQSHKTQTGMIKGKVAYMPPEQLQGHVLDRRVDVYALGVVLYELLTGRNPFEATTDVSLMQAILFEPLVPVSTYRPELPQALVQILDRMLAKVREHRYADCIALQADLERFILSTGEPVGARELAHWVERICPKSAVSTKLPAVSGASSTELDATAIRWTPTRQGTPTGEAPSMTRSAEPEVEPTRLRDAQATEPEVELEPTRISAAPRGSETEDIALGIRRSRTRMAVALGGLALLAAAGAVLSFRGSSASGVPSPPVSAQPARVQPMVAAAETRPAEPPPTQPVEAPPAPEQAPQVAVTEEKPPAPEPPTPAPAVRRKEAKGRLVFRIRPYATVLLDGTALGQTPLAPVQVAAGPHTVRLINRDLDKDITRTIEVKPGKALIFKYDLYAK